jgi:hypothetical protein
MDPVRAWMSSACALGRPAGPRSPYMTVEIKRREAWKLGMGVERIKNWSIWLCSPQSVITFHKHRVWRCTIVGRRKYTINRPKVNLQLWCWLNHHKSVRPTSKSGQTEFSNVQGNSNRSHRFPNRSDRVSKVWKLQVFITSSSRLWIIRFICPLWSYRRGIHLGALKTMLEAYLSAVLYVILHLLHRNHAQVSKYDVHDLHNTYP